MSDDLLMNAAGQMVSLGDALRSAEDRAERLRADNQFLRSNRPIARELETATTRVALLETQLAEWDRVRRAVEELPSNHWAGGLIARHAVLQLMPVQTPPTSQEKP